MQWAMWLIVVIAFVCGKRKLPLVKMRGKKLVGLSKTICEKKKDCG